MTGDKVKPQDALSTSSAGPLPATSNSSGGGNGSGSEQFQKEQHQEKLQTLKQRKFDLEKLLNEKNLLLEQIQRQEQQIIAGDHIFDMNLLKGNSTGNMMNLRKKINTTSFKLPNSNKGMMYATKEVIPPEFSLSPNANPILILNQSSSVAEVWVIWRKNCDKRSLARNPISCPRSM